MTGWYAIRAKGTGAEVAIYDEIGAHGISAKGFLAELGALADGTPIDVRLNSPGGSVFDAVAIHNASGGSGSLSTKAFKAAATGDFGGLRETWGGAHIKFRVGAVSPNNCAVQQLSIVRL